MKSLTNLKLDNQIKLTGQPGSRIHLPLLSQHRNYDSEPLHLAPTVPFLFLLKVRYGMRVIYSRLT